MNSTGESTGEDGGEREEEEAAEEAEDETEEEYRLRVYGSSDCFGPTSASASRRNRRSGSARSSRNKGGDAANVRASFSEATSLALRQSSSSARRLSRSFSRQLSRRRSSLVESLPDTPAGWTALVTTAASAVLAYELRLQQSLTEPPNVFCQDTERNDRIRRMLSSAPGSAGSGQGLGAGGGGDANLNNREGVLSRPIKPSLLVGTRGLLASMAAYAVPHRDGHAAADDADDADLTYSRLDFRELMTMGSDGAQIAVDWSVPPDADHSSSSLTPRRTAQQRKSEILEGPITRPVVLVLHGINNDSSFGYVRSLMRTCTDRGWVAAGFNFRGCGGVPLRTPRGYNGAYTGDLRDAVNRIVARMPTDDVPLFVVGNSLGANLITKYLGEEGRCGTLPPNVAGGVSLGNPLHIHSGNMATPWAEILGLGVKKMILLNWRSMRRMTCFHFRDALRRALTARTIGQVDDALAPFMIRNDPEAPFAVRVGYEDGEDYWDDASSYKHVQFVSVPLMKITARDDFLVYGASLRKLSHCLECPNVLVVKTKCGGHLGWQEAPPDTGSAFGFGTSWADAATADFIEAVIKLREEERRDGQQRPEENDDGGGGGGGYSGRASEVRQKEVSEAVSQAAAIRSKL